MDKFRLGNTTLALEKVDHRESEIWFLWTNDSLVFTVDSVESYSEVVGYKD